MEYLTRFLAALGRPTLGFLVHLNRMAKLGADALRWTFIQPFKGQKLRVRSAIEQSVRIGWDSIPIVAIIAFFVGLILAMQAAYQLKPFGATIYVANLVAVAQTRSLGPIITAIVIAGRSGSAIAAELGTMKVAEEIDALRTMGLNPTGFLVVPRVLAMCVMLPALVLIADIVGIFGAYIFSVSALDITSVRFINQTATALVMKDVFTGLIKTVFFGIIIVGVGCYQGFIVEGGAEGVGRSTTNSVVVSIFLIIFADVLFTAMFLFLF
ncbi:MAG: MlaE family ABC transporter permease [bacterium]